MASATAIVRCCLQAPAKLNLHLELLNRRSDGYHDLETVMVAIDLCDDVSVQLRDDHERTFHCRWSPHPTGWRWRLGENAQSTAFCLPSNERNLAWKAAESVCQTLGFEEGFAIDITKRIPMGAGLGGASADAAGVLVAFAQLMELDPCSESMMQIAEGLGSDVPFLVAAAAGTMSGCIARGRGEQLQSIAVRKDLHFVLLYPPQPLSTKEVYEHSRVPSDPLGSQSVVDFLCGDLSRPKTAFIHNRLQSPACELEPQVVRCLAALRDAGAMSVALTGSGSTCFGLCRSAMEARRMARQLSCQGLGIAMAVRPFNKRANNNESA